LPPFQARQNQMKKAAARSSTYASVTYIEMLESRVLLTILLVARMATGRVRRRGGKVRGMSALTMRLCGVGQICLRALIEETRKSRTCTCRPVSEARHRDGKVVKSQ
jgi:hypothetical protein